MSSKCMQLLTFALLIITRTNPSSLPIATCDQSSVQAIVLCNVSDVAWPRYNITLVCMPSLTPQYVIEWRHLPTLQYHICKVWRQYRHNVWCEWRQLTTPYNITLVKYDVINATMCDWVTPCDNAIQYYMRHSY